MKKQLLLILCLVLLITGCGSSEEPKDGQANPPAGVEDVLKDGMNEEDSKSNKHKGGVDENAPEPEPVDRSSGMANPAEGVDIDLTALSATMVYSEVYNMLMSPEDYTGKVIKMEGKFASFHDDNTGNDYYACIISDATACCSQGLEFTLSDSGGYPKEGSEICVVGTLDTYKEGNYTICTLREAKIVK